MKTLVVGHRGAAAYALENTAASFAKAIELGADMIEFDVRESLDGEFMVVHDTHLGRISPYRNVVRRTHSRVLKSIELHQQQRLLTLSEACQAIPPEISLMVEIKAVRGFDRIAALMAAESKRREVLLTSFDLSVLKALQVFPAKLRLGVVAKTFGAVSRAQKMGIEFSSACLDYHSLNGSAVVRLKNEGRKVFAWTVDRRPDIERMLEYEVDGVVSNRPDQVRECLESLPAGQG